MFERTTEEPTFTQEDYKDFFDEACVIAIGAQKWYYGLGIAPSEHPLASRIPFDSCLHCDSDEVMVIAAQHTVHPYSGDCYWDYEIVCEECGTYTQRSYSENDSGDLRVDDSVLSGTMESS